MAQGIELRADAQRSLGYGSITSSYASIGTSFQHVVRLMIVQNFTDVTLQFSFDGVVDHFVLPSGGQLIMDVTTNGIPTANGFFIAIGTLMSVKTLGSPSTGSVYVSAFYAQGS